MQSWMRHCSSVCNIAVSKCLDTPLTFWPIFLGKVWTLKSDGWIQNFTTRGHKILDSTIWFAPIATLRVCFAKRHERKLPITQKYFNRIYMNPKNLWQKHSSLTSLDMDECAPSYQCNCMRIICLVCTKYSNWPYGLYR